MYTQIVVYPYNEIAFSYKIEWYLEYHNTNESQNNYAELKKTKTAHAICFLLHKILENQTSLYWEKAD